MWIVKIALQRPYTFIVLAILILLMGVFAILRTATDIFPNINIPVVAAIWNYTGLQPEEMATPHRPVHASARRRPPSTTSSTPSRSRSNGIAVVKYFFQPNVDRGPVVRADHRRLADAAAPVAAGNDAAVHPRL